MGYLRLHDFTDGKISFEGQSIYIPMLYFKIKSLISLRMISHCTEKCITISQSTLIHRIV